MKMICGVDEAGRGPIAGPVTAAAVILPDGFPVHILRDSKKMTPGSRRKALTVIMHQAAAYAVGWSWPEEIDRINIHYATLAAMKRAVSGLSIRPALVLVDGKFTPDTGIASEAIVGGDGKIPEIQAASIVAKVVRDLWMERYSWIERNYLFEKHKGYPTEEHRRLCGKYGLSPIHRRSFRIVYPS